MPMLLLLQPEVVILKLLNYAKNGAQAISIKLCVGQLRWHIEIVKLCRKWGANNIS